MLHCSPAHPIMSTAAKEIILNHEGAKDAKTGRKRREKSFPSFMPSSLLRVLRAFVVQYPRVTLVNT